MKCLEVGTVIIAAAVGWAVFSGLDWASDNITAKPYQNAQPVSYTQGCYEVLLNDGTWGWSEGCYR